MSARAGAFTAEQAQRGERGFRQSCSQCHVASSFAGKDFARAWSGRTAYDIFETIRTTMPTDGPGRLSRAQYAEIVAYLLRLNDYPAGPRALPDDDDGLRRVHIDPPAGQE